MESRFCERKLGFVNDFFVKENIKHIISLWKFFSAVILNKAIKTCALTLAFFFWKKKAQHLIWIFKWFEISLGVLHINSNTRGLSYFWLKYICGERERESYRSRQQRNKMPEIILFFCFWWNKLHACMHQKDQLVNFWGVGHTKDVWCCSSPHF